VRPAIVVSFVLGCSSAPAAPVAPSITLSVSNATIHDVAQAFATATGEPLVVTPDAERWADCVHLSLHVPAPRPVPEVATLLDGPLRAEGFMLTRAASGWTLAHEGGPPSSCAAAVVRPSPVLDPGPAPIGAPPPPTGPVSEETIELPRADRDAWLADSGELARSARVVPHQEGGVVVGVRLYGIRPSSPMARLGFSNGDTVYAVNGYSMASPERVLEAYSALRDATEYRVDLSRRGERRTHVIRIVD
jgi:hypothetical protein